MSRLTYPHIAVLLATLILLTTSAFAQTPPADLPYDVAPWPVGDSLKMPNYPQMAKVARVGGVVVAVVYVSSDGKARLMDVSERPPDVGFRDEIREVADDWRFVPAMKDGNAVGAYTQMKFEFRIAKDSVAVRVPSYCIRSRPVGHPLFTFDPWRVEVYVKPPKDPQSKLMTR